ncbi:MAG TPA: hypothetical protein VK846_04745 [Candidatus Limnocylindria bacterium]|nr:hypothetical protein [Candidatus Limnocylindria bacterium]
MNFISRTIGCSVALLLFGCVHRGAIAGARDGVAAEFVGSTPGGTRVQEFLGGLASTALCHSVTWQVTLFTNQPTGRPSTFSLTALYHVPMRSNPNRSEDGPKVAWRGTWEILPNVKSGPGQVIYRLTAGESKRSLSFVKVSDGLLHLLNPDGSLAVGNGGESFTLNRADQAEKPGDTGLAMNAPSISYKISPLATGPTVFGVFEGRTPCLGISRELNISRSEACIKAKWRVTLYQNPETLAPTTYKVEGSLFRDGVREGTWSMTSGAATDTSAIVYQLNATPTQPALLLFKADHKILFFLKQNRQLLIGHADFSYTLNRVAAK